MEGKISLGYVHIPNTKRWAPYLYEDGQLTVYTANNLNIDDVKNAPKLDFTCEYKYLVGKNMKNATIVFFVDDIPKGAPWTSSSSKVHFYFTLHEDSPLFSGISFHCKELDYFYDSFQSLNIDIESHDKISLTTKNNRDKSFYFQYRGVSVHGSVNTSHALSMRSPTPFKVKTTIYLSFSETNDFAFIMGLYTTAFKFICFISQRQNVFFDEIRLHQTCISNSGETYIGSTPITINADEVMAEDKKVLEATLPYSLVEKHLSDIWQFIADNKLYAEHLPENSGSGRHYTIAKMILIMAAFEWNANRFLDVSLPKSPKALVKTQALAALQSLSEGYSSKQKSYLKSFIRQIELYDVSLSDKIQYTLNRYEDILLPFIAFIYALNEEPLNDDYKKTIGNRVQDHRNAFAHGDIQKEIDPNIILDLHVLQWSIYCIILEAIGFTTLEMKKVVHYFRDGTIHTVDSICNHYDHPPKKE